MKIAHKLAIAGVFLSLPLAGLCTSAFYEGKAHEESLGDKLAQVSSDTLDKLDRNLFERYGDVQAFSVNGVLQHTETWHRREGNEVVAAMNQYVDLYDVYLLTIAVDLEGEVIAVNDRDDKGRPIDTSGVWKQNFAGEGWFKDALAGRFHTRMPETASGNDTATGTVVVPVHEDATVRAVYSDKSRVMGFAAPIKGKEGETIAVWYNIMDFSLIESVLAAEYQALSRSGLSTAHFTLLGPSGDPISDLVKGERRPPVDERGASSGAAAGSPPIGWLRGDYQGKEVLAGYARSQGAMGFAGMGWTLWLRADSDEVLLPVQRAKRMTLLATAAAALTLLIVAALFLRSVSRPVSKLTESAKRLAQGDLGQSFDHRADDEVGQLSEALRGVSSWLTEVSSAADAVSRGDLSRRIEPRSQADVLSHSFQRAQGALVRLNADSSALIAAVRAGRLSERAVTSGHDGAYGELLGGINGLVEVCARPIQEAQTVLAQVANRNLSARLRGEHSGDWAAIQTSLNQAAENLDSALGQVVVAADQVSAAAGEITIGNQSLARAASDQASSLDEVTNTLQAVSTSGEQTARNAQEARGMAQAANAAATRGGSAMLELSKAIEQIKAASDRTAQIVKTIDEIAFQTNLLALNAAVEAARAGDAGRGFAVVAEEVRNLAMRSAEAARTTGQMIEDAVKSAEQGVSLNAGVSRTFDEIRGHVGKVVEVMEEIAASSQQQAQSVAGIHGMVDKAARATQQNAATTEQSASAAEELAGQASSLRELVQSFELSGSPAIVHVSARKPARPPALPRMVAMPTKSAGRPRHLRSVPPPGAQARQAAEKLIPFDDDEGSAALAEF